MYVYLHIRIHTYLFKLLLIVTVKIIQHFSICFKYCNNFYFVPPMYNQKLVTIY